MIRRVILRFLAAALCCIALLGLWQFAKTRPLGESIALTCHGCGKGRFAIFYAGAGDRPDSLVIVLHGYKSTAKNTIAATRGRYQELATSPRIVVAHAQSEKQSRNWYLGDRGSIPPPRIGGKPHTIDDYAYIDALWREAQGRYSSLEHVHLVGMSRGAMAAYAFTCKGRLPVESLTVFSMPMPEMAQKDCDGVAGVDFALVNGTRDQLVPYDGGQITLPWLAFAGDRTFGRVAGTEETLEYWRTVNACDPQLSDTTEQNEVRDGTRVVARSWTNCADGSVRHIKIVDGGHRWDNEAANPLARFLLGRTTRERIGPENDAGIGIDLFRSAQAGR